MNLADHIQLHHRSLKNQYQISVLVPSWNNLPYLKLCIGSLQKHSQPGIQIIVVANEAKDGTLDWLLSQEELDFVYSPLNLGICFGLNAARPLVKGQYIAYLNDDMYVLPNWDRVLLDHATQLNTQNFMLSGTMIEPQPTGNPCVVVCDFGQNLETFQEEALLQNAADLKRNDWNGSSWPPILMPLVLWDLVGGMSIEYSPGMYSDPDLSRKLYAAGVRIFKGCGHSLVYHFGSKSTKRVNKNKGRYTFLLKWGISSAQFYRAVLKMGGPFTNPLSTPKIPKTLATLKRILATLKMHNNTTHGV